MDKASYIDGIIALLKQHGATDRQIVDGTLRDRLSMAYDNDWSFENAARSAARKVGIEVE